jgi:nitroreductase
MAALARRQSTRRFKPNGLPLDVLSDLLWAANGTNRPDSGKRTAATARNWQDLDVYVATARGLFRHDVVSHVLVPVQPGDLRAKTGTQPFVGLVPVNLLYVADAAKVPATLGREDLLVYGGTHAGIVAQNVYLFAASAGLGTVLRASIDRPALETAMGLGPKQRVVMAQSVGYPEPEP